MITLILGDSKFPNLIIKSLKTKKKDFLIIDLSKKNIFKKEKNSFRFSIGKFGSMINLIKNKKSKKVLFAGKIHKPNFSKLRLDLKGILYMPSVIRASKLGDAAIIKSIINILEKEKIKVVRSNLFNTELTLKKGNYTHLKPIKAIQNHITFNFVECSFRSPSGRAEISIFSRSRGYFRSAIKPRCAYFSGF